MANSQDRYPVERTAGGLNRDLAPEILRPDEASQAVNVEFDRGSVASVAGSIKVGNQAAPTSGVRTRVDLGLSPLALKQDTSVPLRGSVFVPYSRRHDIGGDFVGDGAAIGSEQFHSRRGRDFELVCGVRIPREQRVHGVTRTPDSGIVANPSDAGAQALDAIGRYDEALDACTIIWQKGGDRTAVMSAALGIVNVGDRFHELTGSTARTASRQALVFMWLDAPEWSENNGGAMKYILGSGGADVANAGETSTLAYRAVLVEEFLEPGTAYRVAVGLQMDTGSPDVNNTPSNPTCSWNENGDFWIAVHKEGELKPNIYRSGAGMHVWKGPDDSIEYIKRYGIRYSGKDASHIGLGYRFAPWKELGFIPFGLDSASLEKGGMRLSQVGSSSAPTGHALTATHTAGDTYVEVNLRGLTDTDINGTGSSPLLEAEWSGVRNRSDALKGYWLAFWNNGTGDVLNGARVRIDTYEEVGSSYRLECGLGASVPTWAAASVGVICFRWEQIELEISDVQIYSVPRDPGTTRYGLALQMDVEVGDATHPGIENLIGYWPLGDSDGAAARDVVSGNTAYMSPFGLGQDPENGGVFLSGEGEALVLDLAEDPVLKREIENMLRSDSQGFAVEVSCVFPEAYYGIAELNGPLTSVSGYVGKFAPDILTWESADGAASPLLELTHRSEWGSFTTPVRRPMGFMARVSTNGDQDETAWSTVTQTWDPSAGFYWDDQASWVGTPVKMQIGVQPAATAGLYDVYLAFSPKSAFLLDAGDAPGIEASYFRSNVAIEPRDLLRSRITIGGRSTPGSGTEARGYSEMGCRLVVREVRVYTSAAPGSLPPNPSFFAGSQLGVVTERDGKLSGAKAMPSRVLEDADIRRSLGDGVTTVNVTKGSTTITPSGPVSFWTAQSAETVDSIVDAYLVIPGDEFELRNQESGFELYQEMYRIVAVAADGRSATLSRPYQGPTRTNAAAHSVRLMGYTRFQDDVRDQPVTLGRGRYFQPGVSQASDAVMTTGFFRNRSTPDTPFSLRIFSPLAASTSTKIMPQWTRGCMEPRQNPIRGLHKQNERLYAATQGGVYEVIDRWDDDAPEGSQGPSVQFLSASDPVEDVLHPLARDWVEFPRNDKHLVGGTTKVYDFWVKIDRVCVTQTLAWVGALDSSPLDQAGDGIDSHAVHAWFRISNGRPEVCVGSTAEFAVGRRPEKGLFCAQANESLPVGRFVRLRFLMPVQGTNLLEPQIFIGGRKSNVSILSRELGLTSPVWLDRGKVPVAAGRPLKLILGAARDAYASPCQCPVFEEDKLDGQNVRPGWIFGFMHSLSGWLHDVVISEEPTLGVDSGNYDASRFQYSQLVLRALYEGSPDYGHLVEDSVTGSAATLVSHPFISLYHGFGGGDGMASAASFRNKVYMTNGGRPVFIDGQQSGIAGVLPPNTKPRFETLREPIWKPNTTGIDPVGTLAGEEVYHYNFSGNTYFRQGASADSAWEEDDYFGFKCYWRPSEVQGERLLFSSMRSASSGQAFVSCVDGKIRVGWYDHVQKRRVWVETDKPVFEPGFVHYVYVRKRYPDDAGSGSWVDSVFEQTAAEANDSIVVRRFREVGISNITQVPTIEAKCNGDTALSIGINVRNCISFTTDLERSVPGTTAVGLVSNSTATYNASGIQVTATTGAPFHPDMTGMYWQWGDTATAGAQGKTYRISQYVNSTVIRLVELDGSPAVLSETGANGGVFTGIKLVKSEGFATSTHPDEPGAPLDFFGSQLADSAYQEFLPLRGEAWSFACAFQNDSSGTRTNVDVFESALSDEIETGTDDFAGLIFQSTKPGELHVDTGFAHTAVDVQPYSGATKASTQPNRELQIEMDAQAGDGAKAAPMSVERHDRVRNLLGSRLVRVAFFSELQNTVSLPGPELLIELSGEDGLNPSGDVNILLSDLPVSSQPDVTERWIYMSLDGGQELYRVARVLDNESSEVSIGAQDYRLETGLPAEFDRLPPPRCRALAASQNVMVYGGLELQPDGVQWSKPYRPEAVPPDNFLRMNTGAASDITAVANQKGRVIISKRDAAQRAQLGQGEAYVEDLSENVGIAGPVAYASLDATTYFVADRQAYGYAGVGSPDWLARRLGDFLREIDPRYVESSSAAINRERNQFVYTSRIKGRRRPNQRVSVEYDDELSGRTAGDQRAGHRISTYEYPNVTALSSLDRPGGGVELFVGGTSEGFVVYLDRAETSRVMMGPEGLTWGPSVMTVNGTGLDYVTVDEVMETALLGARGSVLTWTLADGQERSAAILAVQGRSVFLDEPQSELPAVGGKVRIGDPTVLWESPWLDLGRHETREDAVFIDLVVQGVSGSVTAELLLDRNDTVRGSFHVELGKRHHRWSPAGACARWFKIRLTNKVSQPNAPWQLLKYSLRTQPAESK